MDAPMGITDRVCASCLYKTVFLLRSMVANTSLRYGFEWDQDYLIEFAMLYQTYAPAITLVGMHPITLYLLLFQNNAMRRQVRICFILTHLALILNEWIFCFAFRIYMPLPIAGIYCDGPLCRAGFNNQIVLAILAAPIVLICVCFVALCSIMHHNFLPAKSKGKLTRRMHIWQFFAISLLLSSNVPGFGWFGKDHDKGKLLLKEPELAWLTKRGGTMFIFGPPGDAQYFRYEILLLALSMVITVPYLIIYAVNGMKQVAKKDSTLRSGCTQVLARKMLYSFILQGMGAFAVVIVPLGAMGFFMIVDGTFIPGGVAAFLRITMLILFASSSRIFCIVIIARSTLVRQILIRWWNYLSKADFVRGNSVRSATIIHNPQGNI